MIARVVPLLVLAALGSPLRAEQLSFLVIVADDLGVMDVGAYNPETFYETPHLDALAARGLRFTDAYAAAPVCSPTRASLMTGLYPARMHTTDWFGAPQPAALTRRGNYARPLLPAAYTDQLPGATTTIAEALRVGGYATFFAGKWHLGGPSSYPEDHGFDVNHGGWERGGPYGGKKYFSPYGNPRLADGPDGEHLPDRLARETAAFITEHADEPFLAVLSFYSVHTPLMTRPDLQAKYEAKRAMAPADEWGTEGARRVRLVQNHAVYAGMVEAMDEAIGVVLAALEASGADDHTVVVFTSDNGGLSTSEGHPTSNLPFRAGKGWLYEGGIREPMIMAGPGVAAGAVCDIPVASVDVMPTLLDLAGLEPARVSDGASLVPLLWTPEAIPPRALFWHYPHYGNQGGAPGGAIRLGRWKLVEHFETGAVELYDLEDDPGETTDCARTSPVRTAHLRARLRAWRAGIGARMPTVNPGPIPDPEG